MCVCVCMSVCGYERQYRERIKSGDNPRLEVRRGREVVNTSRNSLDSVDRDPFLLYARRIAIGNGVPLESLIRFAIYEYEKPFVWLSLGGHANRSPWSLSFVTRCPFATILNLR